MATRWALRRGKDSLSSGTRVVLLSSPTVSPVRVRTLAPIPVMVHRAWFDQNGQQHHEAIEVDRKHVETEIPMDNLIRLRAGR